MHGKGGFVVARLGGAAVLGLALLGACAEEKGGLILAIDTDMKAPQDVNAVSVSISTNGTLKHSFIGRVTPEGEVLLPATLAIVESDDPNATIRVRVMAFQGNAPRVLRDVVTTVPRDGRTGLLRIPLNFLNDGSTISAPLPDGVLPPVSETAAIVSDFDFMTAFKSDCPDPEHQTFIDGECKDSAVDPNALPDYADTKVFGATGADSDETCFDVGKCFEGAQPVPEERFDAATCSADISGIDPATLNIAISNPKTGECVRPGECFIPLDRDVTWFVENGRARLPPAFCKRLRGKGHRIQQTTGKCPSKTDSQPLCRPKRAKFTCASKMLDTCAKCIATHCDKSASKCFGPAWVRGEFTGVCKPFIDCFCTCADGEGQCDKCSPADTPGCDDCFRANIERCSAEHACPCGDQGNGQVNLTFTPGEPPPLPAVGPSLMTTTATQADSPQDGAGARVATATGAGPSSPALRITYCSPLKVGDGTMFKQPGTQCEVNPRPSIAFGLTDPNGGKGPLWIASQGTLRVLSLDPLSAQFIGVTMTPSPNGGGATGTFTIDGTATWR